MTDFLADATADLLAEQRRAMLERAGITVQRVSLFAGEQWARVFEVRQEGVMLGWYDDDDAAYAYAYELAGDLT